MVSLSASKLALCGTTRAPEVLLWCPHHSCLSQAVQDGSLKMDGGSLPSLHPGPSLAQHRDRTGLTPEHCLQVSTPQKLQRLLCTVLFRRLTSFRGLYTTCLATTACVSITSGLNCSCCYQDAHGRPSASRQHSCVLQEEQMLGACLSCCSKQLRCAVCAA